MTELSVCDHSQEPAGSAQCSISIPNFRFRAEHATVPPLACHGLASLRCSTRPRYPWANDVVENLSESNRFALVECVLRAWSAWIGTSSTISYDEAAEKIYVEFSHEWLAAPECPCGRRPSCPARSTRARTGTLGRSRDRCLPHLLLFVRTRDAASEKLAIKILSEHSAFDARIHSAPDRNPSGGQR
jgi:hypothetical protein